MEIKYILTIKYKNMKKAAYRVGDPSGNSGAWPGLGIVKDE
jgi:hypothetical protein